MLSVCLAVFRQVARRLLGLLVGGLTSASLASGFSARLALLSSPVQSGEVVPEIRLDNRQVVRDATVVAVQATSVSFKVGARLYNIPTEQLPAELRTRIRRMFPQSEPVGAAVQPEGVDGN